MPPRVEMFPGWLCCKCKTLVKYVKLGLGSDHCLVLEWACPQCNAPMQCSLSLSDLIGKCPDPPIDITDQDVELLKEMKISLGE